MLKLGELLVDDEKMFAFVEWLEELVEARRKRQAHVQEEIEKDETDARRCERLIELAKQWARKNGHIDGMPAAAMARATWETFQEGDGWFSEMDVDYSSSGDAEWRQVWEDAYINEITEIRRTARP